MPVYGSLPGNIGTDEFYRSEAERRVEAADQRKNRQPGEFLGMTAGKRRRLPGPPDPYEASILRGDPESVRPQYREARGIFATDAEEAQYRVTDAEKAQERNRLPLPSVAPASDPTAASAARTTANNYASEYDPASGRSWQQIEQARIDAESQARISSLNFKPATTLKSAYAGFLGTPTTPSAGAPPPSTSGGPDLSQVNSLIQQLTSQATEGRATREANAAAMRDLLQGRIKEASAPVDVNSPGLRPILAAQRLARQRSAERQQSQVAARLSREGLLDSGAFDTATSGIEQARGEGESADIAATLAPEQQARRQELLSLYQMALSQGDNETAQALQEQLAALGASAGVAALGEQGRQFNATFGEGQRRFAADEDFRRSSFLDNLKLAMAR